MSAYESLAADGLLVARVGSGTLVSRGAAVLSTQPASKRMRVRRLLKDSHYPSESASLLDPDGNPVNIYR